MSFKVPNRAGAVDARARLACYPWRSFYPISHGLSTQHRGITLLDFRLCSTCRSHSQAPLCQYTQRTVSIRAEGTFRRLRYLLGGNRPSQTTHQTLSPSRDGLEPKLNKSGISPLAPPRLTPQFLSLPPILHMHSLSSVPSYSKAARVFLSCRG